MASFCHGVAREPARERTRPCELPPVLMRSPDMHRPNEQASSCTCTCKLCWDDVTQRHHHPYAFCQRSAKEQMSPSMAGDTRSQAAHQFFTPPRPRLPPGALSRSCHPSEHTCSLCTPCTDSPACGSCTDNYAPFSSECLGARTSRGHPGFSASKFDQVRESEQGSSRTSPAFKGLTECRKLVNQISLYKWYLFRPSGSHYSNIAVGGFLVVGGDCNQRVETGDIVQRLEKCRLLTRDGIEVRLLGLIDDNTTIANGFSVEIIHSFLSGFPYIWNHLLGIKCQASGPGFINGRASASCDLGEMSQLSFEGGGSEETNTIKKQTFDGAEVQNTWKDAEKIKSGETTAQEAFLNSTVLVENEAIAVAHKVKETSNAPVNRKKPEVSDTLNEQRTDVNKDMQLGTRSTSSYINKEAQLPVVCPKESAKERVMEKVHSDPSNLSATVNAENKPVDVPLEEGDREATKVVALEDNGSKDEFNSVKKASSVDVLSENKQSSFQCELDGNKDKNSYTSSEADTRAPSSRDVEQLLLQTGAQERTSDGFTESRFTNKNFQEVDRKYFTRLRRNSGKGASMNDDAVFQTQCNPVMHKCADVLPQHQNFPDVCRLEANMITSSHGLSAKTQNLYLRRSRRKSLKSVDDDSAGDVSDMNGAMISVGVRQKLAQKSDKFIGVTNIDSPSKYRLGTEEADADSPSKYGLETKEADTNSPSALRVETKKAAPLPRKNLQKTKRRHTKKAIPDNDSSKMEIVGSETSTAQCGIEAKGVVKVAKSVVTTGGFAVNHQQNREPENKRVKHNMEIKSKEVDKSLRLPPPLPRPRVPVSKRVISTAFGLKTSRSGRLLVPPLEHWRGQSCVRDMDGGIIAISDGSNDTINAGSGYFKPPVEAGLKKLQQQICVTAKECLSKKRARARKEPRSTRQKNTAQG